jgi:prepilin-type processing-associated H-X9-DG protein
MTRNRRRVGFSLVELLIVVGIIVVLVGLLVPSVSRARGYANRARCANNLRQILMATQQYVLNDAENRLPIPNWGPGGTYDPGPAQPGWLYNYPHNGVTEDDMQTGALWPYIKNEPVYHCPLHNAPYLGMTEHITSYLMDGSVCDYGHSPNQPSYAWSAFKRPSEQILYFECDATGQAIQGGSAAGTGYWNDGSSFPYEVTLSTRHGQGCNMGYFDFHVELYDLNQFQLDLTLSPGPLWDAPTPTGH